MSVSLILTRQLSWVLFLFFLLQDGFYHKFYIIKSGVWVYMTEEDLAHLYLFAQRMYKGIAVFFPFESMINVLLTFIFMSAKKLFLRIKNSCKGTPHNFLVVVSLDITIIFPSSVNLVFHTRCLAYGISKQEDVCFIISCLHYFRHDFIKLCYSEICYHVCC